MSIFKDFWRKFVAAFRAERQGGEAAKASREHEVELRHELADERECRRVAKLWAKAETPAERSAVMAEVRRYVLRGPESRPTLPVSANAGELTDELDWSSNSGAYESHLARRYNNPYFSAPRRLVSKEELGEAKRIDSEDLLLARQRFDLILTHIEALPTIITVSDLHRVREDLDNLVHFALGVGGPAKDIASQADKLRDVIILNMREAFSDDEENLKAIDKADFYHRDEVGKYNTPFVAQMLRENGPIPDDETIPALLSEDPMTISIMLDSIPEEDRKQIRLAALMIIRQALEEGYRDPQFEEKLAVLSA